MIENADVADFELGKVAVDIFEDEGFFHVNHLDPAGVVGVDEEGVVADVTGAGVGSQVETGEVAPVGKKRVVGAGFFNLAVIEVGAEDFGGAFRDFGGASTEFVPMGAAVMGVRVGIGTGRGSIRIRRVGGTVAGIFPGGGFGV